MPDNDNVSGNDVSEWYVILAITGRGQQRVAIAQDMDGPVLCTAANREEAIEQANQIATLMGFELYNSQLDE